MKWGRVDQDAAIFHENELVEDFEFSAGIQEQGRSRELKKMKVYCTESEKFLILSGPGKGVRRLRRKAYETNRGGSFFDR